MNLPSMESKEEVNFTYYMWLDLFYLDRELLIEEN